jgi:hypothetical protein
VGYRRPSVEVHLSESPSRILMGGGPEQTSSGVTRPCRKGFTSAIPANLVPPGSSRFVFTLPAFGCQEELLALATHEYTPIRNIRVARYCLIYSRTNDTVLGYPGRPNPFRELEMLTIRLVVMLALLMGAGWPHPALAQAGRTPPDSGGPENVHSTTSFPRSSCSRAWSRISKHKETCH